MKINELILKLQQRFWSKKDNLFTEENQKIGLGVNYDKKLQSIDLIEQHAYTKKDLAREKYEIKCNAVIK